MPIESSTLDIVVSVSKEPELVGKQWIEEITRVRKPGGVVVMQVAAEQTGSEVRNSRCWKHECLIARMLMRRFTLLPCCSQTPRLRATC